MVVTISMKKRPLSVTIIGYVFIAAGVIALSYHLNEFRMQHPPIWEALWISLIRLLAVFCGIFMLRGSNWARWLALAWLAYHVVLSAFHPLSELVTHALLLAIIGYFLLRRPAAEYFRGRTVTVGAQQSR